MSTPEGRTALGASRRAVALALLALATLALATFAEALFGARVFFQRDILTYWYPGMVAFRNAVAAGSWPLWNPHLGFGAPLLADASLQIAYPPTWLALVLPLDVHYKLFVTGHCLGAGIGTFLLARRLGLGALAATVAGGAFALSGPFLSAASLFHHYAGAAFMPWVVAALESLVRRPGLSATVGLGLAAGGQLLAGSGDMCLATGVIGVARLAWHVSRSRPVGGAVRRLAGPALLAAGLGLTLGALQWLPTAEQARRGSRPEQGADRLYWSLHPASIVDLAVPRLVSGAPLGSAARKALFERRPPLLECLYLGAGVLALGALALAAGGRGGRLSAAGAVFFLVAALGRHTTLSGALAAMPGFALMRYPQKHLLPFALCVALAAGFGAATWASPWPDARRRVGRRLAGALVGIGLVLAAAAAWLGSGSPPLGTLLEDPAELGPASATAALRMGRTAAMLGAFALLFAWRAGRERAPAFATALLVVLAALDLVAVGRTVNPLAPPELVAYRPPLVDTLAPHMASSRLHSVTRPDCARVVGGPPGWETSWLSALAFVDAMKPPSGVRWGLFGSYEGGFTGLEPRRSLPLQMAAARLTGQPDGTRLLQLGNVGHVLVIGRRRTGGGLELLETPVTPYECPLQLLRVPDPLPRAYVVASERRLGEPGDDLAALLDPAFDPRREVLLADARPGVARAEVERGLPREGGGPIGGGTARVVSRSADAVEVAADLPGPGVLVLVEAFDAGWRVSVDGRRAPLLRANVLFRGVRLDRGSHRVRFEYRPVTATLGLGFGVASALATAGLALVALRRSRGLKPVEAAGSIAAREEGRP